MAETKAQSIQTEAPAEGISGYRLRKAEDESVYGPIDKETMIAWAQGAQIAPNDLIDECDDKWKVVSDFDFLEMFYSFPLPDGSTYGPTTLGTVAEFVQEGLIQEDTEVTDARSKKATACGKLLKKAEKAEAKAAKEEKKADESKTAEQQKSAKDSSRILTEALDRHQRSLSKSDKETGRVPDVTEAEAEIGVHGVNLAKDQRIRQLEEDLRILRKDHDELLHKYRKLNQELIEARQKK